jgi:hypothetical protein
VLQKELERVREVLKEATKDKVAAEVEIARAKALSEGYQTASAKEVKKLHKVNMKSTRNAIAESDRQEREITKLIQAAAEAKQLAADDAKIQQQQAFMQNLLSSSNQNHSSSSSSSEANVIAAAIRMFHPASPAPSEARAGMRTRGNGKRNVSRNYEIEEEDEEEEDQMPAQKRPKRRASPPPPPPPLAMQPLLPEWTCDQVRTALRGYQLDQFYDSLVEIGLSTGMALDTVLSAEELLGANITCRNLRDSTKPIVMSKFQARALFAAIIRWRMPPKKE